MTDVYLESGAKRVIASSLEWPGWCRGSKDEAGALDGLLQAAPRYAQIVEAAGLKFKAPKGLDDVHVVERVPGNVSTDMGVPEVVLHRDESPMDEKEQARSVRVLRACWGALDRALQQAEGTELHKGPRGGGRELEAIARHVAEAEAAYTRRVGLSSVWDQIAKASDVKDALAASHERVLEGLAAVARIGVPPPGPRGGARWPARYFVRRVAYHVTDHTWEIEDRSAPSG